MVNRITYVDDRGDLYLVDPAEPGRRLIVPAEADQPSAEARVSATNWPVWSPDGRQIAFSWVSRSATGLTIRLMRVEVATGHLATVYENAPEAPPGIAPNLPHYVIWSPTGAHLAFLTMTAAGQTLFVAPSAGPDPPQPLATGAPFFPVWSPDGRSLLLHLTDQLYRAEIGGRLTLLDAPSTAYRVPAWSPDGSRLAFGEDLPDGSYLVIADRSGRERRRFGPVAPGLAFGWAPDSRAIALSQPAVAGGAYHGLELIEVARGARQRLTNDPLLAFFWAPDGHRIATVSIDPAESEIAWQVIERDGSARRLARFVPSRDTMTALTFFDQYAESVRFWSPESRWIVFAGRLVRPALGNGRDASAAHRDQIYLLDVAGREPPRVVGLGTLAFWSWQ